MNERGKVPHISCQAKTIIKVHRLLVFAFLIHKGKTYCSNSNFHTLFGEGIKKRESIDRLKGLSCPIYNVM